MTTIENSKSFFLESDNKRIKPSIETIALYLPQFHRVPENDEWWGEGFTEWTAVKTAVPLFEGHYQPREPLNGNYYDLLDKNTMKWQTHLAKEYKVSGFCFYHYWFDKGRQILEKPAENLLRWTDIDMPFCFCWANESWARTWSKLNDKNTWSEKHEETEQIIQNENGILLEQRYGREDAWKQHFDYLLSFFRDERYIKKDGKPVFIIYKPELMPCLEAMMSYWTLLANAQGFPGLYIIVKSSVKIRWSAVDAVFVTPKLVMKTTKGSLNCFEYEDSWKNFINEKYDEDQRTYLCGMVDHDATPRRGKRGAIVLNSNPETFSKYFEALVNKSLQMGNDYVFLNAWNEWGEGMYLEPDKKYEYGYLNAVKTVMENCRANNTNKINERIELNAGDQIPPVYSDEKERKYYSLFTLLNKWLILKEKGISLDTYLSEAGFHTIAIYGMGIMGLHLAEELKNSQIKISYAIDQHAELIHSNIPIYVLGNELPEADAVIVTATFAFDEISKKISNLVRCPVISLEELIYES